MALATVVARTAIRRVVGGKMTWINPGTEFTPQDQAELDTLVKYNAIYASRRQANSAIKAQEGVKSVEGNETDPNAARIEAEKLAAFQAKQAADAADREAAAKAKALADDQAAIAKASASGAATAPPATGTNAPKSAAEIV